MRLFRRRALVLDPIGWDEQARRVHDVSILPSHDGGVLLHHSTCWCRTPECHPNARRAS